MFYVQSCNLASLEVLKAWLLANKIKNFIIKQDKEGNFNIVINTYDVNSDKKDFDDMDIIEELQLFEDALISNRVHDYYFSYDSETKEKILNKSFKDNDDIKKIFEYVKAYLIKHDENNTGVFVKTQDNNGTNKRQKRVSLKELSISEMIDKIDELIFKED